MIPSVHNAIEFWYDSIIEFIGIHFEEKKIVIDKIFETKKSGDDWGDYCDAVLDMIDSYFTMVSISDFQDRFIKLVKDKKEKAILNQLYRVKLKCPMMMTETEIILYDKLQHNRKVVLT